MARKRGTCPPCGASGRCRLFDNADGELREPECTETTVQIIDVRAAGTLLVDVREGSAAHDGRWIVRVDLADGSHFYATFDAGPFVLPFVEAGTYRIAEAEASGLVCTPDPERELEIFPGELTVERVDCGAAAGR